MSSPHTILVVDDDDQLRTIAVRILRRSGYTTLEASDGAAALAIAKGAAIHVVLTDVFLPGMEGSTMAAAMRAIYPELPIVFMSGGDETVAKTEEIKGSLFLPKPFTPKSLSETVARALSSPATSGE